MKAIRSRPPAITAAGGRVTGRLKLPPDGAMLPLASIIVSFLAASSAPTPPAVIGGVLVVESGGLLITAREYGIAVIVLAAVALAGLILPQPQPMRDCGSKASPSREGACLVG